MLSYRFYRLGYMNRVLGNLKTVLRPDGFGDIRGRHRLEEPALFGGARGNGDALPAQRSYFLVERCLLFEALCGTGGSLRLYLLNFRLRRGLGELRRKELVYGVAIGHGMDGPVLPHAADVLKKNDFHTE